MPARRKSKSSASLPVAIKAHKEVAARPIMLLVLGPHRSGTSLVTRLLECLGAVNSPNLNPANFANPTGYFEDWDIYQFNENILLPSLGLKWHSIGFVDWSRLDKAGRSRLGLQALEIVRRNYPGTQPLSVLKEPRIGVLLPFWLSVLGHAGFDVRIVCAVRDPVSVARSLATRDNFSITHGGMLYVTSWISILPHIEELPVALVEFDTVFEQPGKVLRSVAEKLHLPLPADLDDRLHEFTSNQLDPSLRHFRLPPEDVALEPDLPPIAVHLHEALVSAARSQNIKRAARVALASDRTIEAFRPVLADFDQLLASSRGQSSAPAEATPAADNAAVEALTREHDQIASQLAEVQAEREELMARLATAEVSRQEAAARQAAMAETAARLAAAEQELHELRASTEQHEKEREALVRLEELERRLEDLGARHRSLIEERATLESGHSDLVTRHSSAVAELDSLRHELIARQAEQNETQAKLATAEEALSEALTAREKSEADAKDTIEENKLLLDQLHQVQEELEKYFLENRELKQQHDHLTASHASLVAERNDLTTRHSSLATALEELQSQHSSLSTLHSSLVAERDDLVTRHSSLATALEELQGQHSSLGAERNELATTLGNLQGRHSSLVEEMASLSSRHTSDRQAQESKIKGCMDELALLAKEVIKLQRSLDETRASSWDFGGTGDVVESTRLGRVEDQPPHRHIGLTFAGVKRQGQDLGEIHFRIVQHHSRYGFCLFQPASGRPPLDAWEEHGTEDTIAYMLVVPANKSSRRFLKDLRAADASFLLMLLAATERALRSAVFGADDEAITARLEPWIEGVAELKRAVLHCAPAGEFRNSFLGV